MSSSSLLVLAASTYQLDCIRTAKRLGLRVVTLDNMPSNPGHALADKSYCISTLDVPAVVEVARSEGVAGVIAPCTDVSVPTQAAVADALGLPGPTPKAAAVSCDKIAFRRFQAEHHFPHPKFRENPAEDQPPEQGEWIVKPTRSSGSKGVFIVGSTGNQKAEWSRRIPQSREFSADGGVVAEQFIQGWQGTAEGVVEAGKIVFLAVLDRETAEPPYCATRGHRLPSRLAANSVEILRSQLDRLWRELDYTDGPFDCDFVATPEEVYLLEATPRLGGNGITRLLQISAEFDLAEYAVRQAMNLPRQRLTSLSMRPTSVQILHVHRSGRLRYDAEELDALHQEPWVAGLEMDCLAGSMVNEFHNGRDRLGAAYITAENRDQLDQRIEEFHRRLALVAEDSHS